MPIHDIKWRSKKAMAHRRYSGRRARYFCLRTTWRTVQQLLFLSLLRQIVAALCSRLWCSALCDFRTILSTSSLLLIPFTFSNELIHESESSLLARRQDRALSLKKSIHAPEAATDFARASSKEKWNWRKTALVDVGRLSGKFSPRQMPFCQTTLSNKSW